jgi:hypothetical protein
LTPNYLQGPELLRRFRRLGGKDIKGVLKDGRSNLCAHTGK